MLYAEKMHKTVTLVLASLIAVSKRNVRIKPHSQRGDLSASFIASRMWFPHEACVVLQSIVNGIKVWECLSGNNRLLTVHELQKAGNLPNDFQIPCVIYENLTEDEVKRVMLATNSHMGQVALTVPEIILAAWNMQEVVEIDGKAVTRAIFDPSRVLNSTQAGQAIFAAVKGKDAAAKDISAGTPNAVRFTIYACKALGYDPREGWLDRIKDRKAGIRLPSQTDTTGMRNIFKAYQDVGNLGDRFKEQAARVNIMQTLSEMDPETGGFKPLMKADGESFEKAAIRLLKVRLIAGVKNGFDVNGNPLPEGVAGKTQNTRATDASTIRQVATAAPSQAIADLLNGTANGSIRESEAFKQSPAFYVVSDAIYGNKDRAETALTLLKSEYPTWFEQAKPETSDKSEDEGEAEKAQKSRKSGKKASK